MKYFTLSFLLTLILIAPAAAYAQNFLVGIPGVEQGASGSFDDYIQAIYVMFISIAALLAVVKIIIAGLKYMFTDIVTQKGEAKKDIQGALFGLLIVMSAVLILTVINPELTNFDPDISRVALLDAPIVGTAAMNDDLRSITTFDQNSNTRSIPGDTNSELQLLFAQNCVAAEGSLTTNPDTDELVCNEPDLQTIASNGCDSNVGVAASSDGTQVFYCPTDSVTVAEETIAMTVGTESAIRQQELLSQGYGLLPGGGSDTFPRDDEDILNDVLSNCETVGGNYAQIYEAGDQIFIECYTSPR